MVVKLRIDKFRRVNRRMGSRREMEGCRDRIMARRNIRRKEGDGSSLTEKGSINNGNIVDKMDDGGRIGKSEGGWSGGSR